MRYRARDSISNLTRRATTFRITSARRTTTRETNAKDASENSGPRYGQYVPDERIARIVNIRFDRLPSFGHSARLSIFVLPTRSRFSLAPPRTLRQSALLNARRHRTFHPPFENVTVIIVRKNEKTKKKKY